MSTTPPRGAQFGIRITPEPAFDGWTMIHAGSLAVEVGPSGSVFVERWADQAPVACYEVSR